MEDKQDQTIVCSKCLSKVDINAKICPFCSNSFENKNPAGTLPVNTLLAGRYTVGRCISMDGEGVLYNVIDAHTMRRVVMKEYVPFTICAARTKEGTVIPKEEHAVLYKTTRMDFIDLYRALAALEKRKGIIQVIDLFEENNTAYAVKEPDSGVPLLAYLQRRKSPMTPSEVMQMLRPMMDSVALMNKKGIIHRGISPETVFVSNDGIAVLSGYATEAVRSTDPAFKTQLFEGFAAPEQYDTAEFDGAYTDVYGMSALVYFCLTGKIPQSARFRRANDKLISPREFEAAVPQYVATAIMRGLRVTVQERTQSVSDLAMFIEDPSKHESGFSLTSEQWKLIIVGAAAVFVVLMIAIGAIIASNLKKSEEPSSVSTSISVEVLPESVKVPNLVGKIYTEVMQDEEFTKWFMFSMESEYSSDYAEGEIISQDLRAGVEVEVGTLIKVIVSRGPHLVEMPAVVGLSEADAVSNLRALGIISTTLMYDNDGSYEKGTVVKTDVEQGTQIDINKTNVILYIAKEKPASSSSSDKSSSDSSSDESKDDEDNE